MNIIPTTASKLKQKSHNKQQIKHMYLKNAVLAHVTHYAFKKSQGAAAKFTFTLD